MLLASKCIVSVGGRVMKVLVPCSADSGRRRQSKGGAERHSVARPGTQDWLGQVHCDPARTPVHCGVRGHQLGSPETLRGCCAAAGGGCGAPVD